ncbi:MAG TPA: hypothetical protein VGQ19_14775 [Burkholderiales bacterium]|nr:hypothetical protein [Burkholderiales bacterium]
MKVLFIARHFTYFRNFESVIASLAHRGCKVHLAADREEALGGHELVEQLAARFPERITVGFTPMHQWGRYRRLARALRLGLDYLRYSDPRYETTPKIRERAYERTPLFVLLLARLPFRRAVVWALERLEQAVPRQIGIDDFMRHHQPDCLLMTPLIELGSPQLDYLRSARALGIPTALCVWSWDHLSSKALIRVQPDRVIVWNEIQKDEAARFHSIPSERVIVTGAQCFDQWFGRAPSRDRDDFCRRVGLPSKRPFILYVCSALFRGSPSEAAFVREWARTIRQSSSPWLRRAGILVRPHPQRLEEWQTRGLLAEFADTVVWGSNPITEESRSDYFDSIFHSGAVVGLNTSALVEAAIVDRPVFTVLLREFHENQQGTLHFRYLLEVGGGFLNAASTLDEHVRQLADMTDRGATTHNRQFVEQFVRPLGIDRPATMVFVEAVDRMARGPRQKPQATPAWTLTLRPLVYALVLAGRIPWIERLYWNPVKRRERKAAVAGLQAASDTRTDPSDTVARVHP